MRCVGTRLRWRRISEGAVTSDAQDDEGCVERLVEDCCGERIAGFPPACRIAIHRPFGDAMRHKGSKALTPARVDTIIACAIAHPAA